MKKKNSKYIINNLMMNIELPHACLDTRLQLADVLVVVMSLLASVMMCQCMYEDCDNFHTTYILPSVCIYTHNLCMLEVVCAHLTPCQLYLSLLLYSPRKDYSDCNSNTRVHL